VNPFYPKPHDVLPMIRELFSRFPEYRHHEAWELQHVLWSLGFCEDLIPEGEITAAVEVARTDADPDEGAA
jgi:hypothetical protein